MAGNEINLKFRITSDGSLKMVTKETRAAANATNDLVNSRNRYNRGEKGVAGATNNSTKAFSKMNNAMTGSSGLVAAYASLAANVFALSAVFGVLSRAAQVEQLTKGMTELGRASGLALQSLSKGLTEATGGAISYADAMRSVANTTSAGLDPSTINRFGAAAKNISIVLGRDVADSFDRLTRGVTKLEPELLDELGLFIRVDEASAKFARSLGKSTGDLTNFEKRLAFANETLSQAEEKFGTLNENLEANPYSVLAASFKDFADTVLTGLNKAIVPLIKFFSKSPTALVATIALLGGRVIGGAISSLINFNGALEVSEAAQKKASRAAATLVPRLNSTATGYQNLANALRTGTATSADFARMQDSVQRSLRRNKQLFEAGTISAATYAQRLSNTSQIVSIFTLAQSQMTLATAKGTLSLILESLAAKEYSMAAGFAVIATQELILANIQAVVALAKARTFVQLKAAALNLLAVSAGSAAAMIGTLVAVVGLLVGIISMVMLAFTFGGQAIEYFKEKMRTDEENALIDRLEQTNQTLDELSRNIEETNLAFDGQSEKIKTAGDRYTALFNIISTVRGEYNALSSMSAGNFEDSQRVDVLNKAFEKSLDLQHALTKAVGSSTLIKSLDEVGKSEAERRRIGEEVLAQYYEQVKVLADLQSATKSLGEATKNFIQSLIPKTQVTELAGAFKDVQKNFAKTKNSGDAFFRAAQTFFDDLKESEFQLLGLSEEKAKLDNAKESYDRLLKSVTDAENALKELGDAAPYDEELKNRTRAVKVAKKALQVEGKKYQLIIAGEQNLAAIAFVRANTTATEFQNANTQLIISKNQQASLKNSLKLEKAKGEITRDNINSQLDLEDQIRSAKQAENQAMIDIYTTLSIQTDDMNLKLSLQEHINRLTSENAALEEEKTNDLERQVKIEETLLSRIQLRQKFEKAVLDGRQRSLDLLLAEADAARTLATNVQEAVAAQEGRSLTSEEQLVSRAGSGALAEKNLPDFETVVRAAEKKFNKAITEAGGKAINVDLTSALADQIYAEEQKAQINKEKIGMEYELIKAQYDLLEAELNLAIEKGSIAAERGTAIKEELTAQKALLDAQKEQAQANATVGTGASTAISESVVADERAKEERRIQLRDALIQQGDRLMSQDREMQGLQIKRNAFEAERGVLAQRVADLKAKQQEGEEPSQALLEAEAALQDNISTQLQLRAQQISALMEKAKNLSGGNVPGLEGITAQTANEIVPEVEGYESGTPTAGTSGTGEDPGLSMEERVGQLRETATQMTTVLGELGPEGAAMQTALNGAFTLADTFATAFDSIQDGGMSMQEGLQAAGAVVSALGAMQQAQAQAAVAGVDQQIAAEKKRDGKSKESLAKIAALEKKKEKIERKAFEKKKRAQMAGVIISTASAIMKEAEKGIPASLPGIAMAVALGAAQLSAISSQTYQGGGGSTPSGPSKVSVGNRQNTVDLARAGSPSGELAYARGQAGVGTGMTNYTPTGAFGGMKYRANGGNTAFMVGEQGPELFVPETPGTIVPSDETETLGAPLNVNFTVNAMDTIAMEDMLLNQRGNIIGMIREAANASGETFIESVNVMSDQYQVER